MVKLMLYKIFLISNDAVPVFQYSFKYLGIRGLALVAGEKIAVLVHWYWKLSCDFPKYTIFLLNHKSTLLNGLRCVQ